MVAPGSTREKTEVLSGFRAFAPHANAVRELRKFFQQLALPLQF
jgi:hypothetical protein